MGSKRKFSFIFLLMAAVFLLEPVSYVLADEEINSEEVPYMQGISVELIRFDLNPLNYINTDVFKQCHIKRIEFRYDKQSSINYSDYEFVFDFVLKSKMEDETVIDTNYTYVIDGDSDEGSVSQLDELLIILDWKEDYFSWSFDYEDLVNKSSVCEVKKDLLQQKSYNTVISSVDCYIRRKTDLSCGLISHFDFVWYEDFYKQNCSAISFSLIEPNNGAILDSGSIEHHKFAGRYDSDGNNLYYVISSVINEVMDFLMDIPSALYVLVTGFFNLFFSLGNLFKVTFPFIPGIIFDFLGVVIFITIAISAWMFFRGN